MTAGARVITRREVLRPLFAAALAQSAALTEFQIGCMTLPYAQFPLDRALDGIARAGYRFVGWGTTHKAESGERLPVIAPDAAPAQAGSLARRCRDLGLEPVTMFAGVYVEAADAVQMHRRRLEQAAAAGIRYVITFGRTTPGAYDAWIRNLKQLGPIARDHRVTIAIKQHGGNTATGKACSKILAEVADEGVKMCYDAGNVLDYENADPIPDIQSSWRDVRAFAIKDHRNTPKDEDCGPGFGEIDHYKLLLPVARTGRKMPLVCENIFEPLVARPAAPAGVDALARRAREFLETVVRGVAAAA
ncbi:MAG: sugar phosphate isomerase/epimerase [Acidobacteria bacterium]|nr:sugar phosphate isomerase/epimerase [Acidobacteriota bacterium]